MKSVALNLVMFVCGLGLASIFAISSVGSGQRKANPTQVQIGIMTERQRVHSKLFKTYSAGRKLDVPLKEKRPGKEAIEAPEETVYVEPGINVTSPDVPVLSFHDFLKDLSCQADAVVIATAKDGTSQLTENREFIFTDYVVTVDEVFKNNSSDFIASNNDITVTRPGGRIQIKTRIVNALDSSFQPLITGRRYLLFLTYIPETGSYSSLRKGSFLLQDDDLIALTEEAIPGGSVDPTRVLSDEIRAVLTSGCDRNK